MARLAAQPGAFQSTLPCGSDPNNPIIKEVYNDFNPRSLAGATSSRSRLKSDGQNFNPRSLAGATDRSHVYKTTFNISIHAPLRERPKELKQKVVKVTISIHAPLRERPSLIFHILQLFCHFNPRSLAGATEYRPPSRV